MEVSRFITHSLCKQEKSSNTLYKAIAIQNAMCYTATKYPISFFYHSGYRRSHLVDLVMTLVDDDLVALEDLQNDPLYEKVFVEK